MVRENLNPRVEIIGILPTMYDKRLTHSREADEILRENFGDLVYNTRIRKTIRYAEAPVKGSSVLAYEPTARRPPCIATWRRRCSVARNRASMREGPLAELFRATEAAQRAASTSSASRRTRAAEPRRPSRRGRAAGTDADPRRRAGTRARARPPRSAAPLARWLEPLPDQPGAPRARRATARRTSRSSASSASAAPA